MFSLLGYLFKSVHIYNGSMGISVGIATGYGMNDRGVGVRVTVGSRLFSSAHPQTGFGTNPTSRKLGIGGYFPAVEVTRE
jgi:hypothetical protein